MANFKPLRNYMLYCIDELIKRYGITYPFLDVGSGAGNISVFFAEKGWQGTVIDFSSSAIRGSIKNLEPYKNIEVKHISLDEEIGIYKTVLLLDVLEHIEDDFKALGKINKLLSDNGHLIISVPSNPREWRWDDDYYGHYRRYSLDGIEEILNKAGFKILTCWDCAFPFFWIMRRLYCRLKRVKAAEKTDALYRTKQSSLQSSWEIPFISRFLDKEYFFWKWIYKLQFRYFKTMTAKGHQLLILAQKKRMGS